MLLVLKHAESLTAVLSVAAATTNPVYSVTSRSGGEVDQPTGSLSGATAVTLVASPSGTQSYVDAIQIYNGDTAAVTVTLSKVVSGTSYTLTAATLQTGDTLRFDTNGVHVTDTNGQARQAGGTALETIGIPLGAWRVHDAYNTNTPVTAASDDLAVILGTDGTAFPSIRSLDFKASTTTAYARAIVALPSNYVAGSAVTLRARGGMLTTVSDGTCTVDFNVYSNSRDATGSADICATATQSINSLTFANRDFTITPAGLVGGQLLNIKLAIIGTDAATITAVLGAVAAVELLCSVSR